MAKHRTRPNTIDFYREYGHWFWNFRFSNGKIAAKCEQSYDSRQRCVAAAEEVVGCTLRLDHSWRNGQSITLEVPRMVRMPRPEPDQIKQDPRQTTLCEA